ncbi:MAG: hypothetical protein ACRDMV_03685 [Streptosporangiales bacterium]
MPAPMTVAFLGLPSPGDIAKAIFDTIFGSIADEIAKAIGKLVMNFIAGWLKIPSFGAGSGWSSFDVVAHWTTRHTIGLALFSAGLCIVIVGGKMVWNYTHGVHDSLKNLLSGLVTLVVVNGAVITGTRILVQAGDEYTTWILKEAEAGGVAERIGAFTGTAGSATLLGSALLFILIAGTVLISVIIQMVLMQLRGAMLVVLAGTICLPAATATTETGRKWLGKYTAWLMAFICYKPAAATVFAIAFRLLGNNADTGETQGFFAGLILLGASVLILPAMLRLLTPVGVALAGSAMGAAAGGAMAASAMRDGAPSGSGEPAQGGLENNQSSASSSGGDGGGVDSAPTGAATAEGARSAGVGSGADGGSGTGTGSGTGEAAAAGGKGAGEATASSGTTTAASSGAGTAASSGGTAAGGAAAGAATGGASLAAMAAYEGLNSINRTTDEVAQEMGSAAEGPTGSGQSTNQ